MLDHNESTPRATKVLRPRAEMSLRSPGAGDDDERPNGSRILIAS
jgi:hypothetical protein